MMLILPIFGVLIVFTLLVVAHEFGHFRMARKEGVEVEEFGVGFPPKVYGRMRGKTLYSINALPIGGFVRLKGEDGSDKSKGSFAMVSFAAKSRIIMAGVVVNLLIAYAIFTLLLFIGIPPIGQKMPEFGPIKPQQVSIQNLTIFSLSKDGAAQKAGIAQGDEIVTINSQKISNNDELRAFTRSNAGTEVSIVIKHNGQQQTKQVLLGGSEQAGILGVSAEQMSLTRYSWWQAPIAALVLMVQLVIATLAAFGMLILGLFTRGQVSEQVSGPIGVVSVFSQVLNFGPRFILLFVASISLSLAVINALPLPALDGGRQFMLILRRIGLKITPERENLIHVAGFIALIALMVVISVSDIARLR